MSIGLKKKCNGRPPDIDQNLYKFIVIFIISIHFDAKCGKNDRCWSILNPIHLFFSDLMCLPCSLKSVPCLTIFDLPNIVQHESLTEIVTL